MKKPASSFSKVRLLPKKIRATGMYDERSTSSVQVVNYLSTMYATDDIIAYVIGKLGSYKQAPEVSAALHAKRLCTKALRCGIVYKDKKSRVIIRRKI